jgi:paraquat-inducible protein B
MSATTLGHKRAHAIEPALIGSFLLGGLVLGVLAIILFSGYRLLAPVTRAVIFFQDSVTGLSVGAPVTFRGVRIGSVQSIALLIDPSDLQARIPVYVELEPEQIALASPDGGKRRIDLPRLVQAGLCAQLAMQSIVTGQLQIDLDFRTDKPALRTGLIADVPEIPAILSDLQQLTKQLTGLPLRDLVDQSSRTLRAVELLVSSLDRRAGPVADSIRDTSESAKATMEAVQQAVTMLHEDLSNVARDTDKLVNDGRKQLAASGGKLDQLLTAADRAARDADTTAVTLNHMIEPHSPERADIVATLHDLAATAASLRGFARAIERDPSLVLRGRTSH